MADGKRKYALTKVKAQDYLLPSNDAKTIWRLTTYMEGPSSGVEHMERDETFWGVWKWTGREGLDGFSPDDWAHWEFHEGWHATRAEAINAALRMV